MKRGFAVAVVALVSLAGGCASPARYVEKGNGGGVVAVPVGSDGRAGEAQRREALALIQKHVGPNYEIVDEREVVIGTNTFNNQIANGQQTVNGKGGRSDIQTVSGITTQTDRTEWRIAYRKAPEGTTTDGLPPGLVPNLGPGPSSPPRAPSSTRTISGGAGSHTMPLGGAPRHTEGFPLGAGGAPGSR